MRRLIAVLALSTLGAGAARAADCAADVQAAFEKQRKLPSYRLVIKQQTERGEVETQRDYQAPDRMYNKMTVPGEPAPLETIAIGRWAWGNQGGGWEELQPQFAQSVTYDVKSALTEPVAITDSFACLGKVSRDGKEFAGYRSEPQKDAKAPVLVRTVLIDAASGLPARNIISEARDGAPEVVATSYSYPADITIDAPRAAPAARRQ